MSATDNFEEDVLQALFHHVTLPYVGDATGMGVAATSGNVELSLHDVALTETTTSNATDETTYDNYAKITEDRTSSSWTISGGSCQNAAALPFATCGTNGSTVVHFGLTFDEASTVLQLYGQLTDPLIINNGITPEFAVNALAFTLT